MCYYFRAAVNRGYRGSTVPCFDVALQEVVWYCNIRQAGETRNESAWKHLLRDWMGIYAVWAVAPNIILHDGQYERAAQRASWFVSSNRSRVSGPPIPPARLILRYQDTSFRSTSKTKVYETRPANIRDLKQWIRDSIQGIRKEMLQRVMTSFLSEQQECIKRHDGQPQSVTLKRWWLTWTWTWTWTWSLSVSANKIFSLCLKRLFYLKNREVVLAHLHSSDRVTCWLIFRTLYIVAVGMAWSLLGPSRNEKFMGFWWNLPSLKENLRQMRCSFKSSIVNSLIARNTHNNKHRFRSNAEGCGCRLLLAVLGPSGEFGNFWRRFHICFIWFLQ
jgi:hypothetical protein